MWTELEQALYFKCCEDNDDGDCPFMDIEDVQCKDCILANNSLCLYDNDYIENYFDKCIELSNKIILENREKKLKRICK